MWRTRRPVAYVGRLPMRDDRTLFFVLLRDEYLKGRVPTNHAERKAALTGALADIGWESAAIVSAVERVDDIYFDSISQIRMDAWAKGKVVLYPMPRLALPDRGEGAGLALAEAYVLAGELHQHGSDTEAAIVQYRRP